MALAAPSKPSNAERIRALKERLTATSKEAEALGERAKTLVGQTRQTVTAKAKINLNGDPELKALVKALKLRSDTVSLNGTVPRAESALQQASRAWFYRARKIDLAEQSVAAAEARLKEIAGQLSPLEVTAK
jgi:hypothetical protein